MKTVKAAAFGIVAATIMAGCAMQSRTEGGQASAPALTDPQIAAIVVLVARLGVTPAENEVSRKLTRDGEAVRAALSAKSGAEFDRAYIAHEVGYHQAVIDAVDQLLLPNARNAELKQAIADVRPALVAHLKHAQHLQSTLK